MNRLCSIIATGGLCSAAWAQTPTVAARGIAGAVEVEYPAGRLVAKAGQTPSSPVLVRVVAASDPRKQRIEFMGVTAGAYDLRDYVQRQDGQPAADLASLQVRIVSQLPPQHGTDLFLIEDQGFSLKAYYRELLIGAIVVWAAIPVVVLIRRALRRRDVEAPAAPPLAPPTIADQLRGLLDSASSRSLSVDEQGRLELLLFQFFAGDVRAGDPVETIRLLRSHPRTQEIVAAVERWLHGRRDASGTPDGHAASMLREFRANKLTPVAAPGGAA
jgi:hypothetical protein